MPSKPNKYPGLREALLYNETRAGEPDYLSIEELAEKFGCKVSYIYRLRYLLGFKGGATKLQSLKSVHTTARVTPEGVLQDLLNEPIVSPLDRLKILSKLIRTGAPPIKISAIKAIEELTRTSEGRIGPGPPLTDDDKITRLARLLLAIPQTLSAQAWETAYGYPPTTAPIKETLQSDERSHSEITAPVEELLPDLPIPTNRPSSPISRSQSPDESSTRPTL